MTNQAQALADALRALAEGNLGDMPWQANYERIRKVAAEALAQYEKSDTDRDQLREALTTEEQQAVSEELEALAQKWECSGRYSSNRVSAFYRAALASNTAIDPVTVERDKLFEALTPSGDTKATYLGEFKFNVEIENVDFEEDEDESDHNPRTLMMPVYVPWTTIKDIMKAIRMRALGKDQS